MIRTLPSLARSGTAIVAVLLAATAAVSACAGGKPDVTVIRIGVSLEHSGATKSIGQVYEKAIKLKARQLNAASSTRKYRLIIRDNKTDPKQTLANFREFVERDHVSAIVSGACSACMAAATGYVRAHRVPTISLESATATGPMSSRRYLFNIGAKQDDKANALIGELKRQGVGSIGLLAVDNVYGAGGQQAVRTAARRDGIRIAATATFPQDATNVRKPVATLAAAQPDVIVAWAVMPAAGYVARDTNAAGYHNKLYLDAGAGAELFVHGAGHAAEGAHMVFPEVLAINDTIATTPDILVRKQWFRDYVGRYGAYSGFASYGADALLLLDQAVRKAKTANREQLRDTMEHTMLDGLTGTIAMSPTNHAGLEGNALKILVVKDGEWRLLD